MNLNGDAGGGGFGDGFGGGNDSGDGDGGEAREQSRRAFLSAHGWGDAQVEPLAPDASKRRYFRLRRHGAGDGDSDDNDNSAMLMDSPPDENAAAFAAVTGHLQRLGLRAPAIAAADVERGLLLLEDLGDQTFSRLLAGGYDEAKLYRLAVDALVRLRQHPGATAIAVPQYDAKLALDEANLLLDWYLPAQLGRPVTAQARAEFAGIIEAMVAGLPPLPPTLVLRDYHIDNLLLRDGECAVLDYQDAVSGSPGYDLASLLEDARRDLGAALRREMFARYAARNPDLDRRALRRHYLVWAAQRHCKVAGIFTRLWRRDGKDAYLRHLPRVLALLRRHLHEPELAPLGEWLERHGQ